MRTTLAWWLRGPLIAALLESCGSEYTEEAYQKIRRVRASCLASGDHAVVNELDDLLKDFGSSPLAASAASQALAQTGYFYDYSFSTSVGTLRAAEGIEETVAPANYLALEQSKSLFADFTYIQNSDYLRIEIIENGRYLSQEKTEGICDSDICPGRLYFPKSTQCRSDGASFELQHKYAPWGGWDGSWDIYQSRRTAIAKADGHQYKIDIQKTGSEFEVRTCIDDDCDELTTTSTTWPNRVDNLHLKPEDVLPSPERFFAFFRYLSSLASKP